MQEVVIILIYKKEHKNYGILRKKILHSFVLSLKLHLLKWFEYAIYMLECVISLLYNYAHENYGISRKKIVHSFVLKATPIKL